MKHKPDAIAVVLLIPAGLQFDDAIKLKDGMTSVLSSMDINITCSGDTGRKIVEVLHCCKSCDMYTTEVRVYQRVTYELSSTPLRKKDLKEHIQSFGFEDVKFKIVREGSFLKHPVP